ncbi:MAG TPA: M57 family metalloprotease [Gemmataceae bacterium]|nr:M57 family metalloprotease [Gemmataceae bacterium]
MIILSGAANNTVGGSAPGTRNVISGNASHGVYILHAGTNFNVVAGNFIGVDESGIKALGNGAGINIDSGAQSNRIGTNSDGVFDGAERNVISGNKGTAIFILRPGTDFNVVAGNYIGVDATGEAALGNGNRGILIGLGAQSNRVGTLAGSAFPNAGRNVISGNTWMGIQIDSNQNVVTGNSIGTSATGKTGFGNLLEGIRINGAGNTIGGSAAGAANLIASNVGRGVVIQNAAATGNTASRNRVFENTAGNIAVIGGANPSAVTPDLRAVLTGATTRVIGTLAGAPLASYRLELYTSSFLTPEAREFLAEVTVTATAAGVIPLDFVVPLSTAQAGGFTLLATRLDTGETSSLSASVPAALVVVDGTPAAPVPEGMPLTFSTRATDPGPGQSVRYVWRVTRGGTEVAAGDEAVFSFTPDDDGAYVLTLTVGTTTGQSDRIDPVPFAVANTAPVVEFVSFPESAPPGAPFDVLARINDLGTADTFPFALWRVWRDGVLVSETTPANPLQFSFTPAANGLYEVELTVRDDEGLSGSRRVAVLVEGEVPEAQVEIQTEGKEGATVHARATLSAVLAQDQLTFEWTATRDGVLYERVVGVGRPNFEFVPDDNGVYVVSLRLSTPFASYTAPPRSVVIENVLPEARIGYDADSNGVPDAAPPTLRAGTAIPFLGTARDVGAGDVHTFRWSVLNAASGQVVQQGAGPTLSFTPPAGGTYVVTLIAEDDDGGTSEVSASIEVAALSRVVTIEPPAALPFEGDLVALTATVSPAPGAVGLHYHWEVRRDGEVVATADSGGFTTTPLPFSFTPTDDGEYEVRLSVAGEDGSTGEGVLALTVRNVVPTVQIVAVLPSVAEGSEVTVTATGFEPGSSDSLTYNWTVTLGGAVMATAAGPTLTFTPADDGAYLLMVEVRDDDQPSLFGSASAVLSVYNVAPSAVIRTATDPEGNPTFPPDEAAFQFHLASGTFDPGTDTLYYAWSVARVDAAGVSHPLPAANHSPTDRPTFSFSPTAEAGSYVVALSVDDREGGVTTQYTRIIAGTPGDDTLTITPNDLVGGATSVLVVAGGGADVIDASAVTFTVALDGGEGDDTIVGGTGSDLILGGAGTDSLVGGAGDDTLVTQHGDDTVVGGDGSDVYVIVPGSDVTLVESGVGGIDVIDFSFAERAVTFDLTAEGVLQTVDAANNRVLFSGTFESVIGSAEGDRLTAAAGTSVFGGAGADQLIVEGAASAVTVFGGDGADAIEVRGASNVTVFGGEGDDLVVLAAGARNVTVFGGDGLDAIEATAAANVTVFGGEGADAVTVTASTAVTIFGGAGNDTLSVVGGSGIAVFGGDAEGQLTETLDAITVFGGSGDDTIEVRAATNATVFGGDGLDAISVLSGSVITVFGGDGADAVLVATPDGQVTVFGGAGDDAVEVTAGSAITVFGGEGDDLLRVLAGAGKDVTVFGGAGADEIEVAAGSAVTVFGGDGVDAVAVSGGSAVTVFGEGGDDVLSVLGGTAVTVFGGDGVDSVRVEGGTAVTVFGGEGADAITVVGGAEVTVFGGEADDAIAVSDGTNVTVFGGVGDDAIVLTGGGANITVFGGEGADVIEAAAATAVGVTVFGGEADDTIRVTAGNGVTVFGGEGDDLIEVGGLAGKQITVFGGDGADTVEVAAGSEVTVFGGDGADAVLVTGGTAVTVFGGEGDDLLEAAALTGSNVTLFGEGGDDTLAVSAGNGVTVFGGDGADTVLVQGQVGRAITVFGGDGADDIAVLAGAEVTVFGGEGDDVVAVSGGSAVTVFGGAGIDTLTVSGGTGVTVFGGEGADVIEVSAGTAVTIFGGEADDSIRVTGGTAVTVFGGDGADTVVVAAPAGSQITIFGGVGDDAITVSDGNGITVFGGEGDDTLLVTERVGKQITIFGGDGADTVVVAAGSQVTVFGEGGNDAVTVAAGADVTVFGGDGADAVVVEAGTQVTVFGEGGADALSTRGAGGTRVNLFGGADADAITVAAGSQITVFGGSGDDTIRVEAAAGHDITVFGGSGDDLLIVAAGTGVTLLGERGNDDLTAAGVSNVTLFGGAGNDRLHGTGGIEISLYGDDGDDSYRVIADALRETRVRVKEIQTLGAGHEPGEKEDAGGSDHIDLPAFGTETLDLSAFHAITIDLNVLGTDRDPLAGWQTLTDAAGRTAVVVLHGFFENVIGTAGADRITGNRFANRLEGRGGNDTLTGLAGDDVLEGGAGDDVLEGGEGNDTYAFAGTGLGSDLVIEEANRDADTLDFSGLAGPVAVGLGSAAEQAQPDVTFTLSDGLGLENAIGSAFADTIMGNDRANVLEGGTGDDRLSGLGGADTYRFAGEQLGTDTLTETGTDSDTLDFAALLGGVSLDLSEDAAQGSAEAGAFVVLADPTRFEGVVGTAFPDVLKGNGADNVLIGGGGRDHIEGGDGNDVLRGGSGQVIYLDFTSATDPWDWQYDPARREAIRDNLARDFALFGYTVTLAPPAAGQFLTVVFNDDQPGGRSEGIDFRNTSLGGTVTVNVTGLLDDLAAALLAAGVPQADIDANWARFVADLSAHVAGHEVGHSLGLRHGDSFGPVGTGVNSAAQAMLYLPGLPPAMVGATETGWHLMSSPAAVGTTLADAARDTFLGLREAIKLAHADTGTTVREAAPEYGAHDTFAEAVDLGRFHGLSVPNSLMRPTDPLFGQSLSAASVAVLGSIAGGDGRRSEDDVYAFAAAPGEWFHFEINSYVLGRVGNPIDSILRVYDSAGNLLAWNDDEFETPDAVILDWQADAAGTFYVVVDTYTPDGVRDFDTGAYELFAYRIAAGPDLGLGDTLVTGAGLDTVYTSAARDTVRLSLGAVRTTVVAYSFSMPLVENLVGAEIIAEDPDGLPLVLPEKTVNDPPELSPVVLPAGLVEGQSVAVFAAATDKQLGAGERLTFRLEAAAGEALPKGLSIDAVTGELRWTPADDGTYRFRVVVADTSGAEDPEDVTAVVANADPTATVAGPARIDEGTSATFTAIGTDAGALDALTYTWAVDGMVLGSGPSFTFHPTANRDHDIRLIVTDGDGGTAVVTRTLAVTNLAPRAAITGMSGDPVELGTVTLTGEATDAGGPAAIARRDWSVVWGGRVVATGSGNGISFTPADAGDYEVTFIVTDRDGATHAASRTVHVMNAAPAVAALPHLTLVEGQPAAFTGAFTDNPADGPFAFLWRVTGPTGPGPDGSAATYSFLPPDTGEYEVLFKVTDKDGATGVAIGRVSVADAAPTATLAQVETTDEGSLATVAFSGAVDSPADLAAGLRYSFDLDNDGVYEIVDSTSPTAARVFAQSGTHTVRGRVTDRDGVSREYETTVAIRNVAPTATPSQSGPAAEGSPITVRLAGVSDPSPADTRAGFRYSFALSKDALAATYAAAGAESSRPFTFADNGEYTVWARVFDQDGGHTDYPVVVTATNAAPVAGVITAPTAPVAVGAAVSVSAGFTDAGTADTHTAVWDWGDGTSSAGTVAGLGATGSHTYTRAGVYTVTLTVRDDDGASHQSFFRYAAVYDTEAGSLNGSGWYDSPAGAYVPDRTLTGKAQFGFVSRYARGDAAPSGNFSLRLGDFMFRSTSYEWLVVSAPRGTLKGTGTVGGAGDYGFLVAGYDGKAAGVDDRVRIKIWDRATGIVIYDNQPGASDDAAPTMPIRAGNIIIVGGSNGLIGPSAKGIAPALTEPQLPAVVAEALARWAAAGAAIDGVASLRVRLADLPGATLGLATPGGIWIDLDAAGHGWFVDPTPADDSEFRLPGDQGEQGRMDLLTVLLHEFGHLLGHDHGGAGLMAESLATGQRLLPDHHEDHTEVTPREAEPPAPAVPEVVPITTVGRLEVFALSVAPLQTPEPVTVAPPTLAPKAATRTPAGTSETSSADVREVREPAPAARGVSAATSHDQPDGWWGVRLEPEDIETT